VVRVGYGRVDRTDALNRTSAFKVLFEVGLCAEIRKILETIASTENTNNLFFIKSLFLIKIYEITLDFSM